MESGGQARCALDNFIDKWDHTKEDNRDYEDAITWEANRDVSRAFYKRKEIFDLRQIHVAAGGKAPFRPNAIEDHVEEPAELDEFHSIVQDAFRSASAVYLEDLKAFKPHPRESLLKMVGRATSGVCH